MNRLMVGVAVVFVAVTSVACDSRECDSRKRIPCDNAASSCQSENCADDVDGTCFETVCMPTLCECLDAVGCAWQATFCDGTASD